MSKKLKIGIIGSGGIAQGAHMTGYQAASDLCEMVAVSDVNETVANEAAGKFGITKIYTDYKDLLADPEIDAVSVCTPNKFHLGPTVDALHAGKHVLCEKPLGMNAEECKEMCRAARDTGKMLQVGLNMRFGGSSVAAKQYIDGGNMGDIYFARAQALRRRGVPAWGVFIDKEKQGGGPLIDIGVHILDLTLFMMGYPKPVAASGKTWDTLGKNPALYNQWGDYDRSKFTVEDFAVALIKFDNGAIVSLESSFMANIGNDLFETQLFGTQSGMIVKGWGDDSVQIFTEQNRQLFDIKPKNVPDVKSSHAAEIKAFLTAINDGAVSPVPGEQGLTLNAVFDAIYKSSETGKEEAIEVAY